MNNNIDLTKILKDCPKGWKFYTPVWGEVTFIEIKKNKDCLFPICIYTNTSSSCTNLTKDGRYLINRTGTECILFPSKEQRDWSKFTAPWYKKERDTIAWLEESGKKEYRLKSFKDEDVRKFMQYIEKQAKAYEFNLPNRSYDIYAFAKDLLVWLEKQGKQEELQVYETEDGKIITYSETDGYKFVEPNFHENERAWLHLVSDVLTWKDGIGQYLDDPRVQELAKKLCSEYAQKLYNPSVLFNTSNTGKNEQKSDNKIESKFHKGDWITIDKPCQIINIHDNGNYIVQYCDDEKTHELSKNFCESYFHFWTIQDARDGDVIHLGTVTAIFKKYIGQEKCICYCSFCKDGGFEIPVENGEDNVYGCYNATPATKEQRDSFMKAMNDAGYEWDIEKKELNKKKKFDPKTLQPFDKILVRRGNENYNVWFPDFVSEPPNDTNNKTLCMCIMEDITMVIPYNDETKNLIGTTYDAPEHYKYWED